MSERRAKSGQKRSEARARIPGALALLLPWLALAWACSAAPAVVDAPAPRKLTPVIASADGWQRELERAVRLNRNNDALVAAERARKLGAGGPRLLALESIARWRLGQTRQAQALDQQLVAAARASATAEATGGADPEVWREVERVMAFHLQTRQRPDAAWAMAQALGAGGCTTVKACQLCARVLALAPADPVALVDGAERVAPRIGLTDPEGRPWRMRWMVELARDLIAARRWAHTDTLMARIQAHWPQAPEVWDVGVWHARRRHGPEQREVWLRRLAEADLPVPVLLELVRSPFVASDRLIVAALWRHIAARPGATVAHRLALAHALSDNVRLGADARARGSLKNLATTQLAGFPERSHQLSLADALLKAGLYATAAPLVARLLRADADAEATLLQAEVLRQQGQLVEAAQAAVKAVERAADKGEMAWRIAHLWEATLPIEAARWLKQAADQPTERGLTALEQSALHELKRPSPLSRAEGQLVTYARALVDAGRQPASGHDRAGFDRREVERATRRFVDRLQQKSHSLAWRAPVYAALGVLATGPQASTRLLVTLAQLGYRLRRGDEALAAYQKAQSLAAIRGEVLDDEAMVAAVRDTGDVGLLARWLRVSDLQETEDLNLSWNIARKLLSGPHKDLGRRWVDRSLARTTGEGQLPGHLPARPAARPRLSPTAGRSAAIVGRQLEEIARNGAADLVLEYIRQVRPVPGQAASPRDELMLGRAEVVALVALGRADDADQVLRRLWGQPDLSVASKRDLMQMSRDANLCALVLEQATELVSQRHAGIADRAVTLGLDCAAALGDARGAFELARKLEKDQITRNRHLHLARELATHGFDKQAVVLFERNMGNPQRRADARVVDPWVRSLLALGRVRDAVAVLSRTVADGRSVVSDTQRVAALLESHGHLQHAEPFRRRAVVVSPDVPELRRALIINLLRSGQVADLDEQVRAWLKLGPKATALAVVGQEAAEQGRLRQLYDIVAEFPDPDREMERFRMRLAGQLGLRKAVQAAAARLQTRGRTRGEQEVRWLQNVGAVVQARSAAQDILASPAPSGVQGGAATERWRVLDRALEVRRDPASSAEALSLARLYVGRALEPAAAAADAAATMARHGEDATARALREVALQQDPDDAGLLCEQGRLHLRAGARQQAMARFERTMAVLVTRDDLRHTERRDGKPVTELNQDGRCLISGLRAAGRADLAASWVRRWLDFDPGFTDLWERLIELELERGRVGAAVAALERASEVLDQWPQAGFETWAQSLVRAGGGPELARWLLSGEAELRGEPWWLAFAASVVLDHAEETGVSAAARRRFEQRLASLARGSPEARLRLAALWARRGDPQRAVSLMGRTPFALPAHDLALRELAAATTAGVLIALLRTPDVAPKTEGQPEGRSQSWEEAATPPAMRELVSGWLGVAGNADDAERTMAALVRQGAPTLARLLLAHARRHESLRLSPASTARRLILQLALGDDAATLAAARAHARTLPGVATSSPDAAQRVHATALSLAEAGRPDLARQLVATDGARVWQVDAPLFPPSGADVNNDEHFRAMVQAWDPAIFARMSNPDARLPPRALAMDACEVAIAGGRLELARGWARRLAGSEDEPWRVWMDLLRRAERFREADLARDCLDRAEKAGAPEGVRGCPQLWLQDKGSIRACLRGRPLSAVRTARLDEYADLALAVARGVEPDAAAELVRALATDELRGQIQWVGALSTHRWAIRPQDEPRVVAHLKALVAAIASEEQRRTLVSVALDDFAALGLADPGLEDTARIFRDLPHQRGARNNYAYALFLAGHPPAEAWKTAEPELARTGGETAHALLDTLAACLWAMGQRPSAMLLQRSALVSAKKSIDLEKFESTRFGGLPIVRLAEWELEQGHHEDARTLARLGMERAWMYVTVQRAREVLRSSLRARP